MKPSPFALATASLLFPALAAHGFKPAAGSPPDLIEKFEQRFVVDSQCERYEVIETFNDGRVVRHDLVMVYQYDGDHVRGLVRVLPDEDGHGGGLALCLQQAGKTPRMFTVKQGDEAPREISGPAARGTIGETPWHFEDMIDDDKQEWDWEPARARQFIEGQECRVLVGNWADPALRYSSPAGERRLYLRVSDPVMVKTEFFDRRGEYFKTLWPRDFRQVGSGERQRAHRIEIRHAARQSLTMMILREGSYDLPLPEGLLEPEFLPLWSAETDQRLLQLLTEDQQDS